MSLVKIQGNASGTGTLTIAAPNTNTDYTLTLPTNTGTILTGSSSITASQLPAGSVLQMVYATPGTLSTSSTSTGTSAPEWGSVTITPTTAGNKLLCILTGRGAYNTACQGESNSYLTYSATGVAETVFAEGFIGDETTSGRPKQHVAVHGQVTTSTTNTYTIRARANGKDIFGTGRSIDWTNGRLTVMEIKV
jgi:hypothetical protein